jgi:hypothetical protein
MRALVLTTLVLSGPALAEPPAAYVPAPASEIPGYSETLLPCTVVHGWKMEDGTVETEQPRDASLSDLGKYVVCTRPPRLGTLTLRELSILRNTIYARYGWAGFRKPWLREHFQKQPWYKPDPKFSFKRLSKVDRRNVALIAQTELSLRYVDLEWRRDEILARVGKRWGDAPDWFGTRQCTLSGVKDALVHGASTWDAERELRKSKDCVHADEPAAKPAEPDYNKLTPEERIELGLLSRAMGEFALDEGTRANLAVSLDKVLAVKELRQLSLRDLRLLRNTIYARRGRPFKSPLLQEHFSHMPWYKPDPAYTDQRLTKTDTRNVALIQQVEKEFGGALLDKDFQRDNPSQVEDVERPEPEESDEEEEHEPDPGLGV